MSNDNYITWKPVAENPGELYFEKLHVESGNLVIFLKKFSDDNKTLKITFHGILIYRMAIEVARMKSIHENFPISTFGISTSSDFLRWFEEESGGMFDDPNLIHIAISSTDVVIDVITNEHPTVEWEENR